MSAVEDQAIKGHSLTKRGLMVVMVQQGGPDRAVRWRG